VEDGLWTMPGHLIIYPAITRDATAYNWRWKREIYAKSRLYVATPSRWLMRKVEQSILASAIIEAKVIPNGVDLTVFHPGDRREARVVWAFRKMPGCCSSSAMEPEAIRGVITLLWRQR